MRLALFLTFGNSLATWQAGGALKRELAIYAEHAKNGISTLLMSYGGPEEANIAADFPWLNVAYNRWGLPRPVYMLLLPLLHRQSLLGVDLIKTNQMYGAAQAWQAAMLYRKPLIVRQGYSHCENRTREHGAASPIARRACRYEGRYLRRSDACFFTTEGMRDRAVARTGIDARKTHIVPNYVVTESWSPSYLRQDVSQPADRLRMVCVGRLSREKNLINLVRAAAGLPVEIWLIGEGAQRAELEQEGGATGVTIRFHGRVDHEKIKDILRDADVFAQVSEYEGHPKSLIEAMVFGMPILASDNPGIGELIRHEETGIKEAGTVEGLRNGIQRLLQMSPDRRAMLGAAARSEAIQRYSLESVTTTEADIFRAILVGRHG